MNELIAITDVQGACAKFLLHYDHLVLKVCK